jgi:hypothetical protein
VLSLVGFCYRSVRQQEFIKAAIEIRIEEARTALERGADDSEGRHQFMIDISAATLALRLGERLKVAGYPAA